MRRRALDVSLAVVVFPEAAPVELRICLGSFGTQRYTEHWPTVRAARDRAARLAAEPGEATLVRMVYQGRAEELWRSEELAGRDLSGWWP